MGWKTHYIWIPCLSDKWALTQKLTMASSKYLLPKFSVLFCQGNPSQCKFSVTPVAPALPPQKALLEGLVRHLKVCVVLVQLSAKFWNLKQAQSVFAVGNGAFAIGAHNPGLYWDATVAPCRLPQLTQIDLFHQNKFVLELLAVILEDRILKSCIFLFTFAYIQWILGLALSFGSSLRSLPVKVACVLAGRKKGIWVLITDSPFAPVFHKGKVAHVVFLNSFFKVTSTIQLF